jgi:lysozyme
MTVADRDALVQQLIRHESMRLKPYKDSVGILTIGVGRNLDHVGISEDEALHLLNNDIDQCIRQLAQSYIWFQDLDPIRQRAMVDLCFNLGRSRLADFRTALAAMGRSDFTAAANAFQQSLWFRQVGTRGPRVVGMIRTGQEP